MDTPEVFFRETIDLNRYSNSVAKKYAVTYNEIIVNAAKQLKQIDLRQQAADAGVVIAPQTRKRLRAIIKQSKDSLATWSTKSAIDFKKELQGVTILQKDFIENELKKVTASGDVPINSVAISPKYAESVIMTDPSKVNIFTSKAFTEDNFVNFGSGKFSLTATQGAAIRLPNGTTVSKAFRGLAESSAERLDLAVRSGVFAGESLDQITRRLVGRLEFADFGPLSVKQLALAGGELTKVANHQISTIVRTSVNQVTNQASQAVYAANKKVAPKYEYVATLDSRTSPICQRLDGQIFDYNKGPTPPQHFNCRSTTVPVVDFDGLQKKYPNLEKPPATKLDTRPSITGRVPQGTPYGNWLLQQDRKLQVKTLGNEGKVNFFKKLAKREGSGQAALRKMIRTDGSERSLKDLERLYGKPSAIKAKPKPKPTPTPTKSLATGTFGTEQVDTFTKQFGGLEEFISTSFVSLESVGGKVAAHSKKMRRFLEKTDMMNHFNMAVERNTWTKSMTDKIPLSAFEKQLASTQKALNKFPDTEDNRKAKGWFNIMKRSVEQKDKNVINRTFIDVMQPCSGSLAGYTTTPSSIVNTALFPKAKPVLKKDIKKILKDSKQSLKDYAYNAAGNVDYQHQWFATMIHEIGHQVHFKGTGAAPLGRQFKKLGGKSTISYYSEKDKFELFAESFTYYVLDPDGLLEDAPRLYNWVEETLDSALSYL